MTTLTNPEWWKAAAFRALRTAAVVALPYVPVTLSGQDYLALGGVALMGAILSLLTSLTGIPEAEGEGRPWYYSLMARVTKTVAQALITAVGAAVFITDVDWSSIPALVVTAAVGSAVLFFSIGSPETTPPPAIAGVPIVAPVAAPVFVDNATQPVVLSDAPAVEDVNAVDSHDGRTGE